MFFKALFRVAMVVCCGSCTAALPVPITTEAPMRDEHGQPIRDCLMPHIFEHEGSWFAYGFGIPANATGDERFGTCYSSPDLRVWTRQTCRPLPGNVTHTHGRDVIYNAKNSRFVARGEVYGKSLAFYTSPNPLGPFIRQPDPHPVFGLAGDSVFFVDDDGKAYLIYNRYSGHIQQRFTYIYQMNEDYTDIIPSTLTNTTHVMEGLWMMKHNRTYYLFGSPLVSYDVADDFYLTAPSPLGPWTYRGLFAPASTRTFDTQVFKGLQVTGSKGTVNVFIGTRWCNPYPTYGRCHPPLRNATSIWLPLLFEPDGSVATLAWRDSWELDPDGGFKQESMQVLI